MVTIDSSTVLRRFYEHGTEFGTFEATYHGSRISIPLAADTLPALNPLAMLRSIEGQDLDALRDEVERGLLTALFVSTLPVGAQLRDPEGVDGFAARFGHAGFRRANIIDIVERFNAGNTSNTSHQSVNRQPFGDITIDFTPHSPAGTQVINIGLGEDVRPAEEPPNHPETVLDGSSEPSWNGGDENEENKEGGQSLLNLLYHIAEDQARRDGYVHRHVTCNSCNTMPIRGIRYRCANCVDFDLCEQCEAMQVHPKTHLFYKVRIPASFLGNPRQAQPLWYPGRPANLFRSLTAKEKKHFCKVSGYEAAEVDALWDQFRCLAATEYPKDQDDLGMAIDRSTFNKCFIPSTTLRHPAPNLIYDRMFAYYDTNGDGLIGFGEFVTGLASLRSKNQDEKMKRVFQGYDIDCDGYVSRSDFLRMFRAYYALTRELTREMVTGMEEEAVEAGVQPEIIMSSQPLSSAFAVVIPTESRSRAGQGKARDSYGDLVISDSGEVLRERSADDGDLYEAVGDVCERAVFGNVMSGRKETEQLGSNSGYASNDTASNHAPRTRTNDDQLPRPNGIHGSGEDTGSPAEQGPAQNATLANGASPNDNDDSWQDTEAITEDAERVLGRSTSLDNTTDLTSTIKARQTSAVKQAKQGQERQDVRQKGIKDRWERRHFYLDEENGVLKPKFLTAEESPLSASKDRVVPTGARDSTEAKNPISGRRNAMKRVLSSSSSDSFKSFILSELKTLQWNESSQVDILLLVDLIINMAEQSFSSEMIAQNLHQLGLEHDEATLFVDWFVESVYQTDEQVKAQTSTEAPRQSTSASRRSRSSSKVRFQDDIPDDSSDDALSNTSTASRSRPRGERWGHYGIPESERSVGREILYQMTQEGLNELLDPIFIQREDLAMEVIHTAPERYNLRHLLSDYISGDMARLVRYQVAKLEKNWRLDRERIGPHAITSTERLAVRLQRTIALEHVKGTHEYDENIKDREAVAAMAKDNDHISETETALAGKGPPWVDRPGTPDNVSDPYGQVDNDNSSTRSFSLPRTGLNSHTVGFGSGGFDSSTRPTALPLFPQTDISSTELVAQEQEDVLSEVGRYSIPEEAIETSSNFHDPTLPQNRPSPALDGLPEPSIPLGSWTPTSPRNHPTLSPAREDVTEDDRDPTLPHHRPSNVTHPIAHPVPRKDSWSTLSSQSRPGTPPFQSSSHAAILEPAKPVPDNEGGMDEALQNKLKYFGMLEVIERQDEQRGGPGRITFEEFEEIMKGPKGQKLGFVGAWIEMASF